MDTNKPNNENRILETSEFIKHEVDMRPMEILDETDRPQIGGLKKDTKTILLLIYLYFLQGLPIGLAISIPLLLSSKKVLFSDQGTFSFAFWPYSIKLLWAPLVDSIYIRKFGRRKSWLVPVQFSFGIILISLASFTQNLLYTNQSQRDIILLTTIFAIFVFLSATQDIAVDGWAINMLSKENVSWQSTCNGVGISTGTLLGNHIFIVLESTKYSNEYIRPIFNLPPQTYGILSVKVFMYLIGAIHLVTSFLLGLFKREHDDLKYVKENLNVYYSYKMILRLFKLKLIRIIAIILLTVKIGFATEAIDALKMIEHGVPKEKLSLMSIPIAPFHIIWPLIICKWTNGKKPMSIFFKTIPIRLIMMLISMVFVYFTPNFRDPITNEYPIRYFMIGLLLGCLNSIIDLTMVMAQLSFIAKISDQIIGGTYMTLLITLSNLGGIYPQTVSLYLVDFFSIKHCSQVESFFSNRTTNSKQFQSMSSNYYNQTFIDQMGANKCSSKKLSKECSLLGGRCITTLDAYYFLVIAFTIFELIWLLVFKRFLKVLNTTPKSEWALFKPNENGSNELK